MSSMSRMLATVAAVAALCAAAPASAWPEKPVRVVVPFGPGGTSDQVARAYQAAIQENDLLSQPMNIVNVGGHFSIGARQVKDAEPDGHTFLVLHIALMGGEATGAMDFGFRDFAPVATTGAFCVLPLVRKDSGIETLDQLLEKAKAEPDSLLFGVNIGAINHMGGILLQNAAPGASFRFVQIGGGAENFTALTGGQTDVAVLSGAEVLNFTRLPDGSENPEAQIRPLAYTGSQRLARLPDVPTVKELGHDVEYCVENWWFAPRDTPPAAIAAFADLLERAGDTDRVRAFRDTQAFDPLFVREADMAASLQRTWDVISPIAIQARGN